MKLVKERHFWILLLLSCAVRIYVWHMTPIVGRDGLDFINIAKLFSEGNLHEGLEHPFHPLYSLLISLGSICGLGFEHSGRIVSLTLSIFTVIALYIIGKKMFNQSVGFVAAFLLAIHPYAARLSTDVMSDSTYFFFYLTGFGLGYLAINTQKWHLSLFAGVASALAYLTRPEGISVLLITGAWIFIKSIGTFFRFRTVDGKLQDHAESKVQLKKTAKSFCLLLIGFLIFSAPYILYLKSETGNWTLTKKKRLSDIAGLSIIIDEGKNADIFSQSAIRNSSWQNPVGSWQLARNQYPESSIQYPESSIQNPVSRIQYPESSIQYPVGSWQLAVGRIQNPESSTQYPKHKSWESHIVSFYKIVSQYADSLHYPLLLFLIIGIVNIIIKPGNSIPNLYITSYIGLFLFVLFFLQESVGYAGYRHLMNIALVTFFWVAIGINISYGWIINKRRGWGITDGVSHVLPEMRHPQPSTRNPAIINSKGSIIFLCLVAALILPKTLKSHRKDKITRKEAGLWLKDYHHGNMTVLTDRLIISLYADARGIELPKTISNYEEIVDFARSKNADYLVLTENIENNIPHFFGDVTSSDLKKLMEFDDKDGRVVIYEVIEDLDDNILDKW